MRSLCGLLVLSALGLAATAPTCGDCTNGGAPPMDNTMLTLSCAAPATIAFIDFASYGTPTMGACGTWARDPKCDAPNSTSIVSAACLGKASCDIFPNTTTFGDPCFGTAKVLAVEFTCSSPSTPGTATCTTPTPAPLPPTSTVVTVAWGSPGPTLLIEPTVQVVSQHNLWRGAPAAPGAWESLKAIGSRAQRWVPWLPYPGVGVAALDPPSTGGVLCGPANWARGGQTIPITLDCGVTGGTITGVPFASFGRPTGSCGAYAVNAACHAATSTAVVTAACVGKTSCTLATAPGANAFGAPPCAGDTWLAAQVTCSNASAIHAHWDLTAADAFFSDWWDACDGDTSEPIPNFSTQPTWLYGNSYDYPESWDAPIGGYVRGRAPASDTRALSDYYGRLYQYFKQGRMIDESGLEHVRPKGAANITRIEVFNEIDYEHGYDPQSYVQDFDAVVQGVRRFADPAHEVSFVGLSLPNIDDVNKVVSFASYFLNVSNHAVDVRDDKALSMIGYHAYPTNGGYSRDPTTFSRLFDYADSFLTRVAAVDAVINALSPQTHTALDETGTDMDNVLTPGLPPPANNPRYWVAAAGYFAYLFAQLPGNGLSPASAAAGGSSTVRVLGASQLMDAPGQEPSVTLLDWESGKGTSRLWVVRLLRDATDIGDTLPPTSAVDGGAAGPASVFAQAFEGGGGGACSARLLLVNKVNADANVTLNAPPGCGCAQVLVLDEASGLEPARAVSCGAGGGVQLSPFAVGVVRFAGA